MRTSATPVGPSIARRVTIRFAPRTDLEQHPDGRMRGLEYCSNGSLGVPALIVVPWTMIVTAAFAVCETVTWLDERADRRWSQRKSARSRGATQP